MEALEVLESNRKGIEELCRDFAVTRLSLFGSALRTDWNPTTSDFDFVVEFGPAPIGVTKFVQHFELISRFEDLLGRPVDVLDIKRIRKPELLQTIRTTAREFYVS